MNTIVIPQDIHGVRELVAVPKTAYRAFLAWQRTLKAENSYAPSAAERRALTRARQNRMQGKFLRLDDLRHAVSLDR